MLGWQIETQALPLMKGASHAFSGFDYLIVISGRVLKLSIYFSYCVFFRVFFIFFFSSFLSCPFFPTYKVQYF